MDLSCSSIIAQHMTLKEIEVQGATHFTVLISCLLHFNKLSLIVTQKVHIAFFNGMAIPRSGMGANSAFKKHFMTTF